MNKRNISVLLALCLLISLMVSVAGCSAKTEPESQVAESAAPAESKAPAENEASAEEEQAEAPAEPERAQYSSETVAAAQRALDYIEVHNVISKHEYYHTALDHKGEIENIWVNEDPWMDTMSWTNNTQKMIGYEDVYGFMVTDLESNIAMSLKSAMANDTKGIITDSEEWLGTGMFWYHMLMSPTIEVAGDGETARAIFQSWGTVTGPMGEMTSQWTMESYGFDCAKMSTGEWKIWHLRTYVYFYCDTDDHWYDMQSNTAASGAGSANAPAGVGVMYDEDGNQITGQTYLGAPGEIPEDMEGMPPPSDMTPPGGDMTPPGGGPGGGGGGAPSGSFTTETGTYFTGFSLYKIAESPEIPEPYYTWDDLTTSY
ncbi:MAG: hypothetical protein E7430_05860 [Ruminococcaceae bacterium]|nr:hypothetical protein [Oscillospiraceae bacterium]